MIKCSCSKRMVLLILASLVFIGCQQKTVVQQEEQVEETPAGVTEKPKQVEPSQEASSQETASQENSEAKRKIEFAQNNLKMAQKGILGYSQVVAICRDVIKQYPSTPYERQARVLLGQIPKDLHSKFNITDEEIGL